MEREGVQRKLAAILYADVAGYSRLTGADEEGTHRTLSASLDFIAATIEGRGGRVIHYAGDAVLAEFASVVVAVESAVEVQRGLAERNRDVEEERRLLYRVGINLGDVIVENLSTRMSGLLIAGPNARELLAGVTDADLGGNAFPFLSGRIIAIGAVLGVTAVRISFTGDLGYELYCPAEYQRTLFDALTTAGEQYGLRLAGSRAMMSLRLEKGFASWGRDLSPDYGPFEAGLDRFVRLDKDDFMGKAAAIRQKEEGPRVRLVTLVVTAEDADAWGGEPVFANGDMVGYVSSGGYGHCVEKSIALAYLEAGAVAPDRNYSVEILGEMRPATLAVEPLFDPKGERMRG